MGKIEFARLFFAGICSVVLTAAGLAAMYGFDRANNIAYANHFCSSDGLSIMEHHDIGGFEEVSRTCSSDGTSKCGCTAPHEKDLFGKDKKGYPSGQCRCTAKAACPAAATCDPTACGPAKTGLADGKCGKAKTCPAVTCTEPTPICDNKTKTCLPCKNGCGVDDYGNLTIYYQGCQNGKQISVDCKKSYEGRGVCGKNGCYESSDNGVKKSSTPAPTPTPTPAPTKKTVAASPTICIREVDDYGQKVGACAKDIDGTYFNSMIAGYYQVCEGKEINQYQCKKYNVGVVSQCANVKFANCVNKCGGAADGCGGTCDSCPSGKVCEGQRCVSAKKEETCKATDSCASKGFDCGIWEDGCGKEQKCGDCKKGFTCYDNKCKQESAANPVTPKKCNPGEKKCASDEIAVLQCNADGTDWIQLEPLCMIGCANGACKSGPFKNTNGVVFPGTIKKPAGFFNCEGVKAGDKCEPSSAKACCWNGKTHGYCVKTSAGKDAVYKYVFDNNMVGYCQQCAAREPKNGVCSCVDITKTDGSKVRLGEKVCGSGKMQNITFVCEKPGEPMVSRLCVNGSICNNSGCSTEKKDCADLIKAVISVINGCNAGSIGQTKPGGKEGKDYYKTKNGYYADNSDLKKSVDLLAGEEVFDSVWKSYKKFPGLNKLDVACTSPAAVPWCHEKNQQVYKCVESPIKNQGCYVWDWVAGGGKTCAKGKDGNYCQYEKKEIFSAAGDAVTGYEYLKDKKTGEKIPTGNCADDVAKITFPVGNKITSHTLEIQGASLVEKVKIALKPDYCIADCYFCEGAGCVIGSRVLAKGTKLEREPSGELSIDYTVKAIMIRDDANFQCAAQCATGNAKTPWIESNPVSVLKTSVNLLVAKKKKTAAELAAERECLMFPYACPGNTAEQLMKDYKCAMFPASCDGTEHESTISAEIAAKLEMRLACLKLPETCKDKSYLGASAATSQSIIKDVTGSFTADNVNPGATNNPGGVIGSGTGDQASARQDIIDYVKGSFSSACNATDKNGAKLIGSRCVADGKCYYAARGQGCNQNGVYCAGSVNKPLYQCFGSTLKSLLITSDGLDCSYLKTVKTCAASQKCNSVKRICE